MKWRKVPPAESGFYWVKKLRYKDTVIVRVEYDSVDEMFYALDEDHEFAVDDVPDLEWYGPLKEPK